MARIELLDDRFVVRSEGFRRLLTVVGTVAVRYEAVASVQVGMDALPGWSSWKVGYNPAFGSRRAGIFWWRGRKWFMDVSDVGAHGRRRRQARRGRRVRGGRGHGRQP